MTRNRCSAAQWCWVTEWEVQGMLPREVRAVACEGGLGFYPKRPVVPGGWQSWCDCCVVAYGGAATDSRGEVRWSGVASLYKLWRSKPTRPRTGGASAGDASTATRSLRRLEEVLRENRYFSGSCVTSR